MSGRGRIVPTRRELQDRIRELETRVAELEKALRVAMLAVDKEASREDSVIPPPIANLLHDTLEARESEGS